MKQVLSSPATKVVALIGGFFAALSTIRSFSLSFNYYFTWGLADWPKLGTTISMILMAAFGALLVASIWLSAPKAPRLWRRMDLFVLLVTGLTVTLLCVSLAWDHPTTSWLLLLTLVSYSAVAAVVAETTAQLRDRDLALHWPRFFQQHPPTKPLGFAMVVLLAGCLWCLLVLLPLQLTWRQLSIPLMVSATVALIALTIVSTHILAISQRYAVANADKIRAERFRTELITNVSHDIRTPLTAMVSYVDLLKNQPPDTPEFAEYLAVLDRRAARLKALIDDLLDASKAGTGNVAVNLKEIDLTEIIGQIAGEFDNRFAESDLTLMTQLPNQPVPVMTDSRHLWRVLENLFSNAAKFAMPGTRVFAAVSSGNGGTVFSLKNTSRELIECQGEMLTDQFIRGSRSRHTEGSGLGLYIAKSLVELMGGSLTVCTSGDLFEVAVSF